MTAMPESRFVKHEPDICSRYLVVLGEKDSEALAKALDALRNGNDGLANRMTEYAKHTYGVLKWTIWPYVAYEAVKGLMPRTQTMLESIKQLRDQGVFINLVEFKNIQNAGIRSDSPRTNTLYVRHPFDEHIYFPAATYNHLIFNETFTAILNYLRSFRPYGLEITLEAESATDDSASSIGVKSESMKHATEAKRQVLFSCQYDPNLTDTSDGCDNRWISETIITHVVNEATVKGVRQLTFETEYTEQYGFNSDYHLMKSIDKLELSFGGKVSSKCGARLTFTIDFEPPEENAAD